jgi:hypothetical protein
MSLTTKQKLEADPFMAYFIDESAPILKWRAKGEMSIEVEVEVLPPGMKGVWDSADYIEVRFSEYKPDPA